MKFKLIFLLFFLVYPSFLYSHVSHYNKIKFIEMDIFRNGKKIGYNNYSFDTKNDFLVVKNETNFAAKLIGLNFLDINGSSIEIYKKGKLIKFKSSTNQNKKNKYNDLIFDESKKVYIINGSSYKGLAPLNAVVGNWWNHNILSSKIVISPISGSLKFQEVFFLSEEI